jgi:hypothetical protein
VSTVASSEALFVPMNLVLSSNLAGELMRKPLVMTSPGSRRSRISRWTCGVLARAGLVVMLAGAAGAFPVDMIPDPVSTGIHSPLASITVSLDKSRVDPAYLEYEVQGIFVDTCCTYLLDFAFPAAVVYDVETELISSPAGGTVSWFNSGQGNVDTATIAMTCIETVDDNECVYRVRLRLTQIVASGDIQMIPVSYVIGPMLPVMPALGQALLVAGLLGLGFRASRRLGPGRE